MRRIVWGLLLVAVGAYLLAAQFYDMPGAGHLWPLLLVLGGFSLFLEFLRHRVEETLLPATTLTLLGAFFLVFTMDYRQWEEMTVLWPFFVLIPGIGFLVVFLASLRWGSLVPASILLVIGGAFLATTTGYLTWVLVEKWWPSVLILAGILVLWGVLRGGRHG